MARYFLVSMILFLGFANPAYAYIDPVTGSVIIQSIIGAFAVALVALRGLRERFVRFFRKKPEAEDEQQETPKP